ncbi:hypothetical protein ACHAPY_000929 [Fusarium culmorum]
MAVELRWWADFAKSTDGAWSRALEEGFQLKGWDTLCMEMKTSLIHAQASMTEEDVAEELNMAISSVNTIYVRSTIARLQGLDHPTSVSITGALQWDVMNPGRYNPKSGFEATPMGCSAKSMLVAMLVVKTKMLKIQTDARGTEEATCEDLDQGWNQKMRG